MLSPVYVSYNPGEGRGALRRGEAVPDGVWIRLRTAAVELEAGAIEAPHLISLSWPGVLSIVRQFSGLQREHGFKFSVEESAREKIAQFAAEHRLVEAARGKVTLAVDPAQVEGQLEVQGWDVRKRPLKPYQKVAVSHLLSIPNGANFSVPGAGKTTVTFAIHLLARTAETVLLVVAPKSAFPSWREIVSECLSDALAAKPSEAFVVLSGGSPSIQRTLDEGHHRLLITYDQLIRVEQTIAEFLATKKVHLVLDESHKMKAGDLSQRGALLLALSHLAMRRDILSGTPMPQRPEDVQSQLDFLWPGSGLGDRIARGEAPRAVLGNLYVRTTKRDLDLPPRHTTFVPVTMADAHKALYSVVRDEFRRRVSELRYLRTFDILSARKSVIRLLQASANPTLLVEAISENRGGGDLPRLIQAVINEGPSTKVQKTVDKARELARAGRKCVIWTIFTDTLLRLSNTLADLRPVVLYGQVPSGSVDDEETREGRLEQFSKDAKCFALIANPAAASEGFSIHRHCHDAIYVDRSYNATHYLQSIDRIHRLGLPPETVTNVWVLQNQAPLGIGSIDYSVSRRLAHKIREMQRLLDDPDLHELALDEENAPQPIEADVDIQDIDDLIKELEGRPAEDGNDVV